MLVTILFFKRCYVGNKILHLLGIRGQRFPAQRLLYACLNGAFKIRSGLFKTFTVWMTGVAALIVRTPP
jgi:hypothetical protein